MNAHNLNRMLMLMVCALLLCALSVSANMTITSPDVRLTYPEPYDRYVDEDDTHDGLEDGDQIVADIYPGSVIEFRFDVKNDFPTSSDIDIDNIFATITVEDLDDGDDVEKESEEFNLEAGSEKDVRISIKVPPKVDATSYTVTLEVEGETNNSDQRIEKTYEFSVKKESHAIHFIRYEVSPSKVSCGSEIQVIGTMLNLGREDEDDAAMQIKSDALGLFVEKKDIFLSEDYEDDENEYTLKQNYVIPKGTEAGNYNIEFRTLFKGTAQMDLRQVPITVICQKAVEVEPVETSVENQKPASEPSQETKEEQKEETKVPLMTDQNGQIKNETLESTSEQSKQEAKEPQVVESVERPLLKSPMVIGSIIVINIAFILIIIIASAKIISKKKRDQENKKD